VNPCTRSHTHRHCDTGAFGRYACNSMNEFACHSRGTRKSAKDPYQKRGQCSIPSGEGGNGAWRRFSQEVGIAWYNPARVERDTAVTWYWRLCSICRHHGFPAVFQVPAL
jgi:hypothetical protein